MARHKLGILGPVDHGKTTLVAAIAKVIQLQQKAPNLTYETPIHTYAFVFDPSWDYQYIGSLVAHAPEMSGAILVVSAVDDYHVPLVEQLFLVRHLGIANLVIFLNKTDLVQNMADLRAAAQTKRTSLTAYGYAESNTPIVSGSALQALSSSNADITTPDYADILNMLQTLDSVFATIAPHIPVPEQQTLPTTKCIAHIELPTASENHYARSLTSGDLLQFFIGNAVETGYMQLLNGIAELHPGDAETVTLELEKPLMLEESLRFVIGSGWHLVAAGTIISNYTDL